MKKNKTVSELNRQIRDFVNDSTIKKTSLRSKKKLGYWDLFFSALDTIDDTCIAIDSFKNLSDKTFSKNKYLITYGLMQALFIQQDGVRHLKRAVLGINLDFRTDYPELYKIRQIRNETVGHPAQTKNRGINSKYELDEVSACTINRSTLARDGFEYILWMNSKTEHKHIKFQEILESQEKALVLELSKIHKQLVADEKQHKQKFAGNKLSSLLDEKTLYQLNLIYGVVWDDPLGWSSFDYYYKQYQQVRQGLEERYGKFGVSLRISGTAEVIKKLDYIFKKLDSFKQMEPLDPQEFEIYVDALCAELGELKDHLTEVDSEFDYEK